MTRNLTLPGIAHELPEISQHSLPSLAEACLVHLSSLLYVVYYVIAKLVHNAFIIFIVPTFS